MKRNSSLFVVCAGSAIALFTMFSMAVLLQNAHWKLTVLIVKDGFLNPLTPEGWWAYAKASDWYFRDLGRALLLGFCGGLGWGWGFWSLAKLK